MAEGTPDLFLWKDEGGTYHVLPVDLVSSHEDERGAEVTSFPVERGADINDHIIQQPDLLTLEIVQTQTPFPTPARPGSAFSKPRGFSTREIRLDVRASQFKAPTSQELQVRSVPTQPNLSGLIGAIGGALFPTDALRTSPTLKAPVTPAVSVKVFAADNPIDRIGELHDVLIDIKQNGRFCKITFRGRVYPDYILKRVRWTSAKGEVGLGRFGLELQSIRIVENAVAKLPDPSSLRLKPSKAQARPPKPVGDPEPTAAGGVQESILSKGTGGGVASS